MSGSTLCYSMDALRARSTMRTYRRFALATNMAMVSFVVNETSRNFREHFELRKRLLHLARIAHTSQTLHNKV